VRRFQRAFFHDLGFEVDCMFGAEMVYRIKRP
jgi:hypothetical protein